MIAPDSFGGFIRADPERHVYLVGFVGEAEDHLERLRYHFPNVEITAYSVPHPAHEIDRVYDEIEQRVIEDALGPDGPSGDIVSVERDELEGVVRVGMGEPDSELGRPLQARHDDAVRVVKGEPLELLGRHDSDIGQSQRR